MPLDFALFSLVFIVLALFLRPIVLDFIHQHGVMAFNYIGKRVASSTGLYIWVSIIIYVAMIRVWTRFGLQAPLPDGSGIAYGSQLFTLYVLALTIVFFCRLVGRFNG